MFFQGTPTLAQILAGLSGGPLSPNGSMPGQLPSALNSLPIAQPGQGPTQSGLNFLAGLPGMQNQPGPTNPFAKQGTPAPGSGGLPPGLLPVVAAAAQAQGGNPNAGSGGGDIGHNGVTGGASQSAEGNLGYGIGAGDIASALGAAAKGALAGSLVGPVGSLGLGAFGFGKSISDSMNANTDAMNNAVSSAASRVSHEISEMNDSSDPSAAGSGEGSGVGEGGGLGGGPGGGGTSGTSGGEHDSDRPGGGDFGGGEGEARGGLLTPSSGRRMSYRTGGLMRGMGDKDSLRVNAMPGEYMLDRNTVNAIGPQRLAMLQALANGAQGTQPGQVGGQMPTNSPQGPTPQSMLGPKLYQILQMMGRGSVGAPVPGGQH